MGELNNLSMLKRQHSEMLEIINNINVLLKKSKLDDVIGDITYNINNLAGKSKIHMMSEDEFLYPSLISSNYEDIKNIAKSFHSEMGNINELFISFVKRYNIPSKIRENSNAFTEDANKILKLMADRINKENNELYPLIEKIN